MVDAKIDVRISNNKMEAYLTVQPASDGQPISRRDIENALQTKGVIYGIRQDVLA